MRPSWQNEYLLFLICGMLLYSLHPHKSLTKGGTSLIPSMALEKKCIQIRYAISIILYYIVLYNLVENIFVKFGGVYFVKLLESL